MSVYVQNIDRNFNCLSDTIISQMCLIPTVQEHALTFECSVKLLNTYSGLYT